MAESHSVKHGELVVLPSILRGLNDLRCCDGDSVTFECTILCTPHPQIRWEKDGKIIPIGADFISAQDGDRVTLTIAEVFPEDEGVYTCIAHNELGKATTAACLVVDVPEEKANLLSQQLSRPTNFLSAESTPRSTPRTTPRATPTRSFSPVNQLSEPRRSKGSRLKQLAPKFYTYPHNRVVEEGGSARFQCAIAGHPMPWVTWDKDGIIVTPSARLSIKEKEDLRILEIEEVTLEDAGLYRLTLENDVGKVEATARLDVICLKGSSKGGVRAYSSSPRRSPCVHRHLIGSAARAGERLKLMADIRSSSTTSYKWYKNGLEITTDTPRITQQIDNNAVSLEINDLKLSDTGEYFVLAQNKHGIASSFADVKVVEDVIEDGPPSFKKPLPPSIDIIEGEPLTLKCEVESNNSFEIEWFRGGDLLPHCDDLFQQFDYGGGRIGLVVNDTFLDDKGIYECVVSNSFGKRSTQVRVNVKEVDEKTFHDSYKYKLEFSKEPLAVATYIGNGTSFCAKVNPSDDYDDHVEVVWVVGDEEIDNKNRLFHLESYEDTHILHIMRVERWMAGEIVCQAKLPNRTKRVIAKATTQLTLMPSVAIFDNEGDNLLSDITAASLLKPLKDITVLRGQTIAIKAYLDGVPEPKVRWFKGVHEIKSEYNTIRPKYSIVSNDKESSLIVTRATDDDAGTYTVRVENLSGGGIATASVSVEGTPDAPNGKPSVLVLNGEVIVTWSSAPYDGSSAITGYVLEMVCVNVPNAAWQRVAEKCHSLTAAVSGLERDEVYRFRVRAVNVHGQGPPSEETDPVSLNDEGDPIEEDVINPNHVVLQGISEFKENYQILGEIGRGNFGTVCLVKNKEGQKLAAKIIKTPLASDKNSVKNEIDIMNCLKHSKLLQLYAAYETDMKIILVTEYISGGELFERVAADDFTLTEDDCIIFMKQICEGVNYMHKNYIVHLDLKPENIMCRTRTSNLIKLIDFGLARRIDPKVPLKVSYGTRDFISPEIANFEAVSFESDMWSVGVICYVLLSGLLPFGGDTWAETLVNISRVEYDFYDEAFDAVSDDAKEFISKLLIKAPQERLTAEQCLNHKWIARYGDVTRNIKLNTEKLKKFVVKRKWHKSGNALRALKRLVTMTAHTRKGSTSRPILEE